METQILRLRLSATIMFFSISLNIRSINSFITLIFLYYCFPRHLRRWVLSCFSNTFEVSRIADTDFSPFNDLLGCEAQFYKIRASSSPKASLTAIMACVGAVRAIVSCVKPWTVPTKGLTPADTTTVMNEKINTYSIITAPLFVFLSRLNISDLSGDYRKDCIKE